MPPIMISTVINHHANINRIYYIRMRCRKCNDICNRVLPHSTHNNLIFGICPPIRPNYRMTAFGKIVLGAYQTIHNQGCCVVSDVPPKPKIANGRRVPSPSELQLARVHAYLEKSFLFTSGSKWKCFFIWIFLSFRLLFFGFYPRCRLFDLFRTKFIPLQPD